MTESDFFNLTASEKEKIDELRERVSKDVTEQILKDTDFFYRYLKADDFDIDEAEKNLRKTLQWRRQHQVDTILEDYDPPEVLKQYFGKIGFATDKQGCAVNYIPVGRLDSKGIHMSVKFSDLERTFIQMYEKNDKCLEKKRKTVDGPYPGFIYIYDMDGFSFTSATDKKGIENFIKISNILLNYYPERAVGGYIINIPAIFALPLSIIKSCVKSSALRKAKFFGTDDWKEELLKIIDADQLPTFLGGTKTDPDGNPLCKTIVAHAGKISESFYTQKRKKSLSSTEGVQKLVLQRASFSEMSLEIDEPCSLIEWEFETKSRDVGFGLFYKESTGGEKEEKIIELIPLLRIDTDDYAETGMFKCEKPGTYIMLFDNSYSWIRSKEIYYKTAVINPRDHEAQLQL